MQYNSSHHNNLTHQILISQINGRTLCIPILDAISLDTLKESIHRIGGVHPEDQRLILNGNELIDSIKYQDAIKQKADFLSIKFALKGGCTGGKGGFGSLLRSAKSVKKTTNYGSCRDLHGRRLRDVQNERRLSEWSEKEKFSSTSALSSSSSKFQEEKDDHVTDHVIHEEKAERRTKEKEKWELQTKEITVGVGNSVEKGLALIKEKELKRKREEEEKKKDIKLFGLDGVDEDDDISESEENSNHDDNHTSNTTKTKNPSSSEPLKKKHCPETNNLNSPSSSSSSHTPSSLLLPPPSSSTPLPSSPLPTLSTIPSSTISNYPRPSSSSTKSKKLGPPVGSKRSADSSFEN